MHVCNRPSTDHHVILSGHVRDSLLIMGFVSAMGWYGCPCMVGFVWPSCGFHMAGSLVFVLGFVFFQSVYV